MFSSYRLVDVDPIEEGETMSTLSRRSFVGVLAAVAAAATAP